MRLLATILLTLIIHTSFSQEYGDKDFYLIDSLQLDALSENDRTLIDSSLTVFHQTENDSVKLYTLFAMIENCWDIKVWPSYNLHLFQLTVEGLKNGSDDIPKEELLALKGHCLNNEGFYQSRRGNTELALMNYYRSLEIFIQVEDKQSAGYLLNNIASMLRAQGQHSKSLEYTYESYKIQEDLGNKMGMGNCVAVMGTIYMEQGDTASGKKFYTYSLALQKEAGYDRGVAYMLGNLGSIHEKTGDYEKSKSLNREAIKILTELGDRNGMARIFLNQGGIFDLENNVDSAVYFFDLALDIYREVDNAKGISGVLLAYGQLQLNQGNISEALQSGKESYQLATKSGMPELISKSAQLLSKAFKQNNQYQDAYDMYEIHIKMRDSIDNDKSVKVLTQKRYQYEYEKQQEKHELKAQNQQAVQEEKDARQKVILIASLTGAGFLALFLIVVFNRLKVTRQQKAIIEKQKETVEEAHSELEEKNQEILDSITYAKRIQTAILPSAEMMHQHLPEAFVVYLPKDIVAGDFYWLEPIDNQIAIAAADCTGHGVPGAMVSVVCHNAMNRSVREYGLKEPGKILDKTRRLVVEEFEKATDNVKDGMDIALVSLDKTTRKLSFAGANNPLWIHKKGASEFQEIKADKQPVGKFEMASPFTTHEVQLETGDTVYIFSDGYIDQFGGEKGKKLKSKGFKEILLSLTDKPIHEQAAELETAFSHWKGNFEQLDDVCVIGIKV